MNHYLPMLSQSGLFRAAIASLLLSVMLAGCTVPEEPLLDPAQVDPAQVDPAQIDPTTRSTQASETPTDSTQQATQTITLSGPGQLLPITATAQLNGEPFDLEVAQTPQQQSLGLMFRSALPDNRGMLFPFRSARRARFWMKDVPVALDMVFIRNGTVVEVIAEVPPCAAEPCPTYGPDNALVDTVLELRSGRAAEISLQTGDTVIIEALGEP